MIYKKFYVSAGHFGVRVGRRYYVVKDTRRHRAYFSERTKHDCRHFTVGHWRFLVRTRPSASAQTSPPPPWWTDLTEEDLAVIREDHE